MLTQTMCVGVFTPPERIERIDHARVDERDPLELVLALIREGHVQVPYGYIDRKRVWQRQSLYSWHRSILLIDI